MKPINFEFSLNKQIKYKRFPFILPYVAIRFKQIKLILTPEIVINSEFVRELQKVSIDFVSCESGTSLKSVTSILINGKASQLATELIIDLDKDSPIRNITSKNGALIYDELTVSLGNHKILDSRLSFQFICEFLPIETWYLKNPLKSDLFHLEKIGKQA